MVKIKWSKGPDEWYCSYGTCSKCNTEFMCSKAHYCPGCGEEIEDPDSCDFCSTIYPDADTKDILFKKGKYSNFNKNIFITMDNEGKYYINIDPGDPYETGYACNIKFCPNCGAKMVDKEE